MLVPPDADRQSGAFTRRQARAAGFAQSTITRRLRDGRWFEVAPLVMVERGTRITPSTYGWIGQLATGGVVSHHSAGAIHGVAPLDVRIHVTVRRDLHVHAAGIAEHRLRLSPHDVTTIRGLRVTSRTRTLTDLLSHLPMSQATTLLFRAVQQGWIDQAALDAGIGVRRGWHGIVQLRRLARLLDTGAHSPAERLLHDLLVELGVEFEANRSLLVDGVAVIPDVLVDERIVIEIDGRRYHSDTDAFARDRRRQNLLVNAGYVVLRFTWHDLTERPGYVRDAILTALAVPR